MRQMFALLLVIASSIGVAGRTHAQSLPAMFDLVASQVAAGEDHGCMIDQGGGVRCWGRDDYGQLGLGSATGIQTAPAATGVGSAVAIATGARHSCALFNNGTVGCWGRNQAGQLGNAANAGTETPNPSMLPVTGLGDVVAIAAAGDHTCALMTDATARCWGSNLHGQLGRAANAGSATANVVPQPVSGIADAIEIAAGGAHSCIRTSAGAAKCWGRNTHGQLGNGTTGIGVQFTPVDVSGLIGAQSLVLGQDHSCARTAGNGAVCWGSGAQGQLGSGVSTQATPTAVIGLTGVAALAAGASHSCAVMVGGGMNCWGHNLDGQLGNPAGAGNIFGIQPLPIEVVGASGMIAASSGKSHTCALSRTGGLSCWGRNQEGQLGGNSIFSFTHAPRPVVEVAAGLLQGSRGYTVDGTAIAEPLRTIATGHSLTCTLTTAGGPWCWGRNQFGQVGNDTTVDHFSPMRVATLRSHLVEIDAGETHSCARTGDGAVHCWGSNSQGQLGISIALGSSRVPVAVTGLGSGIVSIVVGRAHSCALNASGQVLCWGSDSEGQLGDGNGFASRFTPQVVPGLSSVVSIDSYDQHVCALDAGGDVHCWGRNNAAQLGDGSTSMRDAPVLASAFGSDAIAIATGGLHTCVIRASRTAACVGSNSVGQLGNGGSGSSPTAVTVSGLGNVTRLVAGMEHTCAISAPGTMRCWGLNEDGQLGDGSTASSSVPVAVTGVGNTVVQIAAGWEHTCALTAAGASACWGRNRAGELGQGNLAQRLSPAWIRAGQTLSLSTPPSQPSGHPLDLVPGDAGGAVSYQRWTNPTCYIATSPDRMVPAATGLCALRGVRSAPGQAPAPHVVRVVRVVRGQPTLALTSSANPSPPPNAQSIMIGAVLGPAASSSANIVFCANATVTDASCSGGTVLCTRAANASPLQCPVTTLATGTHTITAHFAGDANLFPAVSPPLAQVVSPGIAPTFSTPDTVHFTIGTEATFAIVADGAPTPTLVPDFSTFPPNGMGSAFSGNTGQVAGVPSPGTAGVHPFRTVASNGIGPPVEQILQIVVHKRVPAIKWPAPAAIVQGTALDGTQLNAIAMDGASTVSGSFSYDPPPGTVLAGGAAQILSVSFTPSDEGVYDSVTAATSIDVLRRVPTIDWPAPAAIAFGTPLGAEQLNASARDGADPVPGTFLYAPGAGTVLATGDDQSLSVEFLPDDAQRYETVLATNTIDVAAPQTADLQIAKDATPVAARLGDVVRYTLIATNAGPASVSGARLRDAPPARLGEVVWECVAVAGSGASCPAIASGNGTLAVDVDLAAGAFLRFELFGTVQAVAGGDSYVAFDNSATIALPVGSALVDPDPSNDSATAGVLVVPLGMFANGFEGQGTALGVPAAEAARGRKE